MTPKDPESESPREETGAKGERRSTLGRFLHELNRRHVTRTAAIYAVAGLAVIEFADVVFPLFGIGVGIERAVILLVLTGFPAALLVAWLFEIGPDGIQRRAPVRGLRRWVAVTAGVVVLGMGFAAWSLAGGAGDPGLVRAADPSGTPSVATQPTVEGPEIVIDRPEGWTEFEPVTIAATGRLELAGVVHHSVPVVDVLLNGRRLQLERLDDGVRFTGDLRPSDARLGDVVMWVGLADGGTHVARYPITVALAQREDAPTPALARPEIEISVPAEWASDDERVLLAPAKSSMRVRGRVTYPPGIARVLANGRRLAVSARDQGVFEFSGFVDAPAPGDTNAVEIMAVGTDDAWGIRTFRIATATAPAAPVDFGDATVARNRQRWAVIVGISEYVDRAIPPRRFADDDALAMYNFFRSPVAGMGGIPEDHIRLLVNEQATARNIRRALRTFLRSSVGGTCDLPLHFGPRRARPAEA